MYAYREKPIFSTPGPLAPQPRTNESLGCGWSLLFVVIAYFILSAIFRVTNGYGSKLDQVICFGALIVFVIIILWGARDMAKDSLALAEEKQQWKFTCSSAEVAIVNRRDAVTWDDGYRFHTSRCRLELAMNSDQQKVSPTNTVVSVEVYSHIFKQLEKRNSVRIYYKPEAPMIFLLEEEI